MYKQVLEEFYKEDMGLLSKVKGMDKINHVRFVVYDNNQEDPSLNLTTSDSPGVLETMLNSIYFISKKMDPSLVLSSIRKSRKYDDGIEFVFKTRFEDPVVIANVIGVVGVALSSYLKRIKKKFALEPYL